MKEDTKASLVRKGRKRLYPPIGNPNYLVLNRRREIFTNWLRRLKGRDLRVLDVGGGHHPYKELVHSRLSIYISMDLFISPLVDIAGSGEYLPFKSETFDLCFCTQVLDYIPHPDWALNEINRVLKQGGVLLMSTPSSYPIAGDTNKWRFLPAGLRQLTRSFSHVEIQPEMYSIGGFFRTVNVYLSLFAGQSWVQQALALTFFPLSNLLGGYLDRFSRRNDIFSVNYSMFARK